MKKKVLGNVDEKLKKMEDKGNMKKKKKKKDEKKEKMIYRV